MRLIFATNNEHKLLEIKNILGLKYKDYVYSLNDLGVSINPEENGNSFAENADIKSFATYNELKKLNKILDSDYIVADDTGLCIDYFDGAPGIYSARFMNDLSQEEKNKKIIDEMKDLNGSERSAFFITDLSVIEVSLDKKYIDKPKVMHFVGKVYGYIADKLYGDSGFGYDPIFAVGDISDIIKGSVKTYSILGQDKKNMISHRAKALSIFINYLEKNHNI